jgi:hypothetical protein
MPRAEWERLVGTGLVRVQVDAMDDSYRVLEIRRLIFDCRCEVRWDRRTGHTWRAKPCIPHVQLSPLVDVIVHSQGGGSPIRVQKHLLDRETPWGTWAEFADTGELFASNVDSSG